MFSLVRHIKEIVLGRNIFLVYLRLILTILFHLSMKYEKISEISRLNFTVTIVNNTRMT